jgi:heat-inducible transcriptional repressor
MNLTFDAGFVKTIVIEIATEIQENRLRRACEVINERYYGLMLEEMLRADDVLFGDLERYDLGIIRLFIPSIKKMIAQRRTEVFTEGETNILLKPEFASRDTLGAIVEILEEKGLLMHLFNLDDAPEGRVHISIGGEISHGSFSSFSIVKTRYQVGNLAGCLGIIGPKRMPYPFLVAAVDYTAKALGEMYSKND